MPANGRGGLQIERLIGEFRDGALDLGGAPATDIGHREIQGGGRRGDAEGFAVVAAETAAQALMPLCQFVECGLQRTHVQIASQPGGEECVVGDACPVELVEEPECFLPQ